MGLIVQRKALQAAAGLRPVMAGLRKRDRSLFDQVHRAMNSVVLNIAEADGNDPGTCESAVRKRMRLGQGSPGGPAVGCGLRLRSKLQSNKGGHRARSKSARCRSWRLSGR